VRLTDRLASLQVRSALKIEGASVAPANAPLV